VSTIAAMNASPAFSDFEADERARGCSEVLARSYEPNAFVEEHTHPFGARALVVKGEMWLTLDGRTQHVKAGERFDVPRGAPHTERYGPEGTTYWVARTL
jgi:mannose-6-phosphate isomerase-like protein (cupin superfamily)